tara:strand:+ start:455 stop:1078 length:624 start_codon:yes stop_codon:yes gene_type:complete
MSGKITDLASVKLGSKSIDVEKFITTEDVSEEPTPEVQEEEETLEALQEAISSTYSTPLEMWKMECSDNNLDLKDAARILDTVMTNGFYEETYRMAGRVFKIRTRTTVDGDRLIEMLREIQPRTDAEIAHLASRINLASCLASFADKTFPHTYPSDDNRVELDLEWKDRWDFISSLPQPVFIALAQTMNRFDIKVRLACDARALENF